jgi:hypothetical protein
MIAIRALRYVANAARTSNVLRARATSPLPAIRFGRKVTNRKSSAAIQSKIITAV